MSISIENFVKAIYLQDQRMGEDTRPGTLAKLLNISNAATTDMARSLAQKNLVNYTKYQKLTLTSEGEKLALSILRKHRLWEAFLSQTLNLSLNEIHKEAELLEHATSDFLSDKIDEYLNYPAADPHGDPIPCSSGKETPMTSAIVLSEAEIDKEYSIVRLFSSNPDFFDFCTSNNIAIGTTVRVEKNFEEMKMMEVSIGEKQLLLNEEFTNIIYVETKQ
ncbi:MAG: metal-dependent transcriptional regulator [Bacteroidales bacterium]|jgi:DtxR family Mn-dependent transcriptional regulator|nr:metal-dependent transcriptional regulator [Bacteroidales bacterium]